MNLYQKYRPQKLETVTGNESALESLEARLQDDSPPRAFLLHGPSGCGKTTVARIIARRLEADEMNLVEINTADNRGIDTVREIIENIKYVPMGGGRRVYIIDECHMISAPAQNALLKPLEDAPEHVFFVLCTTDPQKLIKAIRTRCVEFRFSPLRDEQVYRIIRRIHRNEKGKLAQETLNDIAAAALGSPRQAIVLLEQVISLDDPSKVREIIAMGDESVAAVIDLCRALLKEGNSWKVIAKLLQEMKGEEPEKVRRAVLGYMASVLSNGKENDRVAVVMESFAEPTYNTGWAGIVLAAYQSISS